MTFTFTSLHRGGSGSSMVCLHGFTDTWRSWQLVLPALERHHDVLALTLPGHAGGPPLAPELTDNTLVVRVEQSIEAAGMRDAHVVGNSRATDLITTNFEHIPPDLIAHQMVGVAGAPEAGRMLEHGQLARWELDAARITCPVRVVWGTADKLLPWPESAVRYRTQLLPNAEWIELDGVGHCPQLDAPLETAQLILGITS